MPINRPGLNNLFQNTTKLTIHIGLVFLITFTMSLAIFQAAISEKASAYAGNRSKAYALSYCINQSLRDAGYDADLSITNFYGNVQSSNLRFLRDNMNKNGYDTGDAFSEADINKSAIGVGISDFEDTMRCTELAKDKSIGALFGMGSMIEESWSINSQGSPDAKPIGYENGGRNYDLSSYQFFKRLQDYLQSDKGKVSEKEGYERLKQWFEHCTVVGSQADHDYQFEANGEQMYFKRNRSGINVPIIGDDLVRYITRTLNVEVDQSGFGKAECVGKTIVGVANKIGLYDEEVENRLANITTPDDAGAGTGEVNEQDPSSVEENSCETNSGALGWIMCPVAGVLDSAVGFLDEQITQALLLKDDYFRGDSGDKLKDSWTQIRNIAYIVLIPIMLVMVIGTALGFEVFSAYTVKKALPRMVIAVIFIALSWYICLFLVNFFNVVGSGIKGLIVYPFNSEFARDQSALKAALMNAEVIQSGNGWIESASSGLTLGAAGALGIAAGFGTGALSVGIIMSTLATAALILGAVFLLLIARQMILIALFLIAPLAILSWIFPGNDKLWKLWWGSFSKLLMLFPLIMMLIGVGQVFAFIVGDARSSANDNMVITTLIVIAAFIMPFFFIPFAFKWAGGVFGSLAGMVNDREKGLLDRLKKGRSESRAQGWNKFKAGTGTGFAQKNAFTRRVGTGIGAGVGGGKGVFGYGKKGSARLDQMNRQNAIENVMKSDAWNGVNQDDNALHAGVLLQDMNKKDAIDKLVEFGNDRTEAERAVTAWGASGLGGRAAAIAASQQLVSTGTGFKGGYTDKNNREISDLEFMTQTLAQASGGNESTATALAGFANSEAKKNGNFQLAPGFGDVRTATLSHIPGSSQKALSSNEWDNIHTKAWNSGSLYEQANAKPHNLESHIANFEQQLQSNDPQSVERAAVFFEELKQMQPNAKGVNADIINETLEKNSQLIAQQVGSLPSTVRQLDRVKNEPIIDPSGNPLLDASGNPMTRQVTSVTESASQRIQRKSRSYERVDPNRLNES